MATPFSLYENAILTFNVGDGTFKNDPLTGNLVENIVPIVLRAFLTQDSDTSEQMIRGVGIDTTKLFLKGFLTEPQIMPPNIGLGAVGTATIDGRSGKFIVYPSIKSPFKVVNQVLGDPIRGEFQTV